MFARGGGVGEGAEREWERAGGRGGRGTCPARCRERVVEEEYVDGGGRCGGCDGVAQQDVWGGDISGGCTNELMPIVN